MRLNNPIGRVYRPALAELAVKEDMAFNLNSVGLFGVLSIVLHLQLVVHLFKQLIKIFGGAFIWKTLRYTF